MQQIRRASERGQANFNWLESRHTFSFGSYHDPAHMGFGPLRVINDDHVAPGKGFGTHGHQDMQIISYVLDGTLAHKDSLGNASRMVPGEIQRMTAGTGVRHSEYNASDTATLNFLQIWIKPAQQGLAPGYEQKSFPDTQKYNQLALVGSRDGRNGSVTIHQDVDFYVSLPHENKLVQHQLPAGRLMWLHVARGKATVNAEELAAGDAMAIVNNTDSCMQIDLHGETAEVLLFDMAE